MATAPLTRAQWIDRFANGLGAALPWMPAEMAASFAVSAVEDPLELDPDAAAKVYAASLPPADVD